MAARQLRRIGWGAAVLCAAMFAADPAAADVTLVGPAPAAQVQPVAAAAEKIPAGRIEPLILVVGDSLSAEYGLERNKGWVHLLAERLRTERPISGNGQYTVVNASISGETSSGGKTRLPQLLAANRPAVVILELGANDGLRGLPVKSLEGNLQAMVDASRQAGAAVLLLGIRVPPNYGRAYAESFQHVFVALAQRNGVPLVPFLLEGFADQPTMFQADQFHPTREAQPRMLDNVWPRLAPLLARGRRP